MKAKKENKIYKIESETQKQRYLKEGFDIYDDEGNLLEYSPSKKIAYSEYDKLKKENEVLRTKVAELETATAVTEEKPVKKTVRKVGE